MEQNKLSINETFNIFDEFEGTQCTKATECLTKH